MHLYLITMPNGHTSVTRQPATSQSRVEVQHIQGAAAEKPSRSPGILPQINVFLVLRRQNLGTSDKLSVYIPPRDTDSAQERERGDGTSLCVDVFVLGLIPQELKWTGLSQWYAAILGSKVRRTWESVSFFPSPNSRLFP